jgi:hypothetical protein
MVDTRTCSCAPRPVPSFHPDFFSSCSNRRNHAHRQAQATQIAKQKHQTLISRERGQESVDGQETKKRVTDLEADVGRANGRHRLSPTPAMAPPLLPPLAARRSSSDFSFQASGAPLWFYLSLGSVGVGDSSSCPARPRWFRPTRSRPSVADRATHTNEPGLTINPSPTRRNTAHPPKPPNPRRRLRSKVHKSRRTAASGDRTKPRCRSS